MTSGELFNSALSPFEFEQSLNSQGFSFIAGVDEAGRGALAGPVVAAAAIFQNPSKELKKEVRDSKKIPPEKRDELFPIIQMEALSIGVGIVQRDVIDEINILEATFQAIVIAISKLDPQPNLCLIDGHLKAPLSIPQKAITKGDDRIFSIGAASIIAKVTRDRLMIEMDKTFPGYGFSIHKGYGTQVHRDAIEVLGPCLEHRMSFTLPSKRT